MTCAGRDRLLFHGDALCKITRAVDVAAAQQSDVIAEQLQRNRADQRLQVFFDVGHVDHVVGDAAMSVSPSQAMAITGPLRALTSSMLLTTFG